MEPVELREEGLLLRPWRPADADAVAGLGADPSLPRRLHEAALASIAGDPTPDVSLSVVDAATGELLGIAGLVAIDHAEGRAELGYWTAPAARRRGVATAAARAVVRSALQSGLRRIGWRAVVGDHPSRLVAARIGVRFEGVQRAGRRVGDGWVDTWVGALLPGELREAEQDDPPLRRAAARCRVFAGPQPTLRSETRDGQTVRLRPLRSSDAPAIVRACMDPESVRFTTVPHPYDETHAASFIHAYAPGVWARAVEAVFAVADADDELVGTMALRLPGDELRTPTGEVGYLIGPWARRHGYASAALRALCDWGLEHLALHRIEWHAYVGNTASRATAERAGFTIEGELHQALQHRGTFVDAWIGARIAAEGV